MLDYYIFALIIAAFLGLIPANIAKKKGYNFGAWWFYGWMLFIVAIIHVSLIEDKNEKARREEEYARATTAAAVAAGKAVEAGAAVQESRKLTPADELKKFKELMDLGVISEEEFRRKKAEILGFELPAPLPRRVCNYCGRTLGEDEEVIICPACRKEHHVSCWIGMNGCATPGCSESGNKY